MDNSEEPFPISSRDALTKHHVGHCLDAFLDPIAVLLGTETT